jgi:hypothetical protein
MQETQSMHVLQVKPSTFALATANGIHVQGYATQILLQPFSEPFKVGHAVQSLTCPAFLGVANQERIISSLFLEKAYIGGLSCVFLHNEDFWAAFASLFRPVHDLFEGGPSPRRLSVQCIKSFARAI